MEISGYISFGDILWLLPFSFYLIISVLNCILPCLPFLIYLLLTGIQTQTHTTKLVANQKPGKGRKHKQTKN